MTPATCPGCGIPGESADWRAWSFPHTRFGRARFAYRRCLVCQLRFLDPPPKEDELDRFYPAGHYWWDSPASGGLASWIRSFLWRDSLRLLQRLRPPSASLLDFGCGSGAFLALARDAGYRVVGMERDDSSARFAREIYGLQVNVGSVREMRASFDAVTLFHSLEHVPHPRCVLHDLGTVLKPDGVLLVEVPNVESWGARWFPSSWEGWEIPKHVNHFNREALIGAFIRSGFEVRSLRFYSHSAPNMLVNSIGRVMGIESSPSLVRWSAKGLLRCLAIPVARLSAARHRGEVIVAVARRSGEAIHER
ncbi:MAG: methyltransferase domain-containing protein [Actinomycetota bacterium]